RSSTTSNASSCLVRPANSGGRCPAPGAYGLRTGSMPVDGTKIDIEICGHLARVLDRPDIMLAGMDDGNGDGTGLGDAARIIAGWDVPPGADHTEALRYSVQVLVEMGYDRPEDLATIALPALVTTIGKLEVSLAESRVRIDELEEALDRVVV